MGLFSGVMNSLFGDPASNQQAANAEIQAYVRQQIPAAKEETRGLFSESDVFRNALMQKAIDMMGQGVGQQIGAFQQGNYGAQSQLLAGMPQYQRAIMGQQVDYGAFQPQQIDYDLGFLNQTVFDAEQLAAEQARLAAERSQQQSMIDALSGQVSSLQSQLANFNSGYQPVPTGRDREGPSGNDWRGGKSDSGPSWSDRDAGPI